MYSEGKKTEGFTGLEAAIVLLAFVVVTSVFSYIILGAGFYTVQRTQAVIYSAVEQSSSTILVDDHFYTIMDSTTGKAGGFKISMRSPYSILPSDLSKMSITFVTQDTICTIEKDSPLYSSDYPAEGKWRIISNTASADSKTMLSMGDYASVCVHLPASAEPDSGESYSIEIRQPLGISVSLTGIGP